MSTAAEIERLGTEACDAIAAAADLASLAEVLSGVTGKGSALAAVKASFRDIDPEARKELGQVLNRVNAEVGRAGAARRAELDALAELPAGPQVEAAMRVVDAVDPSRGVQVHVVAGPEHRTGVAPGEEAREAAPTVLEAERGDEPQNHDGTCQSGARRAHVDLSKVFKVSLTEERYDEL